MYIGPWQEYKLARLIQHHQEQNPQPRAQPQQRRPRPASVSGNRQQRRPAAQAARRRLSDGRGDDVASIASSSQSGFSGFSTQSAPAQLSAQSRLNDFYDSWERRTKGEHGGSNDALRPPPRARGDRPLSGASTRRAGAGGVRARTPLSHGRPPVPKAKASQASLEETRKSRIMQMQRLYGLAREEPDAPDECAAEPFEAALGSTSRPGGIDASLAGEGRASRTELRGAVTGVAGGGGAVPPPAPAAAVSAALSERGGTGGGEGGFTPDFDRALCELRASMYNGNEVGDPSPEPAVCSPTSADPMGLSATAGSSGGLIAWSKNLRPEELSPELSLANLFRPCS